MIQDEKSENTNDDNTEEWLSDAINAVEEDGRNDTTTDTTREDVCPTCGTSDTEQVAYYWRCNNTDNCDVVTYIP